jgi:hypothetical protein
VPVAQAASLQFAWPIDPTASADESVAVTEVVKDVASLPSAQKSAVLG